MSIKPSRIFLVGGISILFLIPLLLLFSPRPSRRQVMSSKEEAVNPSLLPPALSESTPSYELCKNFYKLTCGSLAGLKDPTGEVEPDAKGEIEALRLYETIIHKHPDWTSEQVDEELVKEIYTEKRRIRLREVFTWVNSHMAQFISSQPLTIFDSTTKEKILQRLRETELELPPPASVYANEPELFTKNDVYYGTSPGNRRAIRIGGAYLLTVKSRFNRVFTIAHELAHSIDPCDLKSIGVVPEAYERLENCYRKKGIIKPVGKDAKCTRDDPMPEVFADWVATQMTAKALEEYKPKFLARRDLYISVMNSVKDLCAQESWMEDEIRSHPSQRIRIGTIFGKSPAILKLLDCPRPANTVFYCSFEGEKNYE